MIRRLFCFRLPTNGKLSVPTKLRPEKGIEFHRPARSPPLRPPAGRPSTQCRQSGAIHVHPEPPAIVSGAPAHGTARTRPNVGSHESVAPASSPNDPNEAALLSRPNFSDDPKTRTDTGAFGCVANTFGRVSESPPPFLLRRQERDNKGTTSEREETGKTKENTATTDGNGETRERKTFPKTDSALPQRAATGL